VGASAGPAASRRSRPKRALFGCFLTAIVGLGVAIPARSQRVRALPPRALLICLPDWGGRQVLATLERRWWSYDGPDRVAGMNAGPAGRSRLERYLAVAAGRRASATAVDAPEGLLADPAPPSGLRLGQDAGALTRELIRPQGTLLGQILAAAGRRVAYVGQATVGSAGERSVGLPALWAMDATGTLPQVSLVAGAGAISWATAIARAGKTADLVVVDLPPGFDPEYLHYVDYDGTFRSRLVLWVSPENGAAARSRWSPLAPILLRNTTAARGELVSATTRTEGLVADVDIAPTVLAHLGVAIPPAMEGHPIEVTDLATPARTRRMLRHAAAADTAMVPVLLGWGVLAFVLVAWAVTLTMLPPGGSGARERMASLSLAWVAGFPLALLLEVLVSGESPQQVAVGVLGASVVVLLAGWAAGLVPGHGRVSQTGLRERTAHEAPPYVASSQGGSVLRWVLAATAAVILADLYLNTRMLSFNLMSNFPVIGARFYGIGNEYQGLLLGIVTLLPCWRADHRVDGRRMNGAATGIVWAAALVAVGAPSMGADFGGALSLACSFLAAVYFYRTGVQRRPIKLREALLAVAVLVAAAAALVVWDVARPAAARSHLGELALRTWHDGGRSLAEMVSRKALLNLRMAATPYFIGGVAAVAPLLALWYHKRGQEAGRLLAARPILRAGLLGTLVGAVATLLLNDTGVVAWAMAIGVCLVAWLDVALEARQAGETLG
jgi:hypothetical protein